MPDAFEDFANTLSSPPTDGFPVTPSDSAELPSITRALNVQASGLVAVELKSGTVLPVFITAGQAFPIRARKVLATGTTATGIIGLI